MMPVMSKVLHDPLTRLGQPHCLPPSKLQSMIRWFIVIFLALMVFSWLTPWLHKLGFGKLPGDLRFRLFGREWFVPLTTTILLSLVASLISQWV